MAKEYSVVTKLVAKTSEFMSGMNKAIDKSKTTSKKIQDNMSKVGNGMKSVGTSTSKYISAPLAAVGVAAFKSASDFEAAQGKMQAQLGLTGKEADKLGGIAKGIWKDAFGSDINDVTESIATVKQNMQGLNDTQLGKATKQALTLRDAFGIEVAESTSAASVLVKNFGIDSTKAFDLMTVGVQKGGDYSGELLDTMREYAPQFSSMGHSADDMMNILISGAKAGAFNLDKVGDAAKEFNVRAADGSKTTAEGFATIGLDAKKMGSAIAQGGEKGKQAFQATVAALAGMEDPVKRNQAGVALFGTQWEDLQSDVISAMGTTKNELGKVNGATKKAGNAVKNNFGDKFKKVTRGLMSSLKPLGNTLLNLAEQWLPKIGSAIKGVSTWFNKLSPTMKTIIPIVALIVAAIPPLLIVLGSVISAVTTMIPFFAAAGTAIGAISAPVLIVIGVIAALIAIVVAVWKNWDTVSKALSVSWNWLKTMAITVFTAISNFLKMIWNGITTYFTTTLNFYKSLFSLAWTAIKVATMAVFNTVKAFIMLIWNGIKTYFITVFNIYKTIFTTVWNFIKTVTMTVFNAVKSFIVTVFNAIKTYLTTALNFYITVFTKSWNLIKIVTMKVFNAIKNFITTAWNTIRSFFATVIGAIVSFVRTQFNNFHNIVMAVFNAVRSFIMGVWNGIKLFFSSVISSIVNFVKSRFNNLKNNISSIFNAVRSIASNVWNSIKSTISSVVSGVFNKVRSTFNNMKSTVSSIFGSIWNIAKGIFNNVKSAITNPIETAKNTIGNIVDSIKGFFSGLKLKIPTPSLPKLPHFDLNWGSKSFFGKTIKYPTGFGVDWYAKGGLMTKPTMFGMNGNRAMVGGEAGNEAIIPLKDSVLGKIGKMIANTMDMDISGELSSLMNTFNPNNLVSAMQSSSNSLLGSTPTTNSNSNNADNQHVTEYNYHLSGVTIKSDNPDKFFKDLDMHIRMNRK